MKEWVCVFVGGGVGSSLRYLVGLVLTRFVHSAFPIGTLAVNLTGCLLIGMSSALIERLSLSPLLRLLLVVGLCGGFTTFSTFANENLTLLKNHDYLLFGAYTAGSLILGIVAVIVGIKIVSG